MAVASLSDYQCECANPNAVKTPQTYKQGPVVRLDKDVREIQKWAGADESKGASMTRETRTALRDKIADYQKQNGIEAKTPGELNKDTLDRMRQDKSLPQGLTDSLQKVNPYYKPDALPRIICVTKPGEDVKPMATSPTAPKANEASNIGGPKDNLDKMGIINQDVPPEREAKFYADMSVKFADMVQKKSGLPLTGKMDDTTIAAMKSGPQFKNLSPQVDKWKSAGLIDKDGNWDQKRHIEMRVESWDVKEPAALAQSIIDKAQLSARAEVASGSGPKQSAPAGNNPFAGVSASSNYEPAGKLNFEGSVQPAFAAAKYHGGPQSLEVMARTPAVDAPKTPTAEPQSVMNISSIVAP